MTVVAGTYAGSAVVTGAAVVYKKHKGKRRPHFVGGISGCGKSSWHFSADHDFAPIFEMARKPTLKRGRKYKKKIILAEHGKIYFYGLDFPGGPEHVEEQYDAMEPKWAVFMTDVEQWEDMENWLTLSEIVRVIEDNTTEPKYITYWVPFRGWFQKKVPFTGKGVKVLTIMLNKSDLLDGYPVEERSRFYRDVADHFIKERPGNPLNDIRGKVSIQFVVTSLKHGTYYPYWDLRAPLKIKQYVDEVMAYV